jgi:hypothetical protein
VSALFIMLIIQRIHKMSRVALIFITFLAMSFTSLRATHIVGGEIYYDCLGGNNYQVTLKVYRDCINGIPPFDDPAYIGVFDAVTGNLITSLILTQPVITTITSTISVPCYAPAPGSVCEEEAIYTTQCNLPPNNNGYMLVYQRCCRNATIVNLINPGGQGSSIVCYMPPGSQAVCNSSATITIRLFISASVFRSFSTTQLPIPTAIR